MIADNSHYWDQAMGIEKQLKAEAKKKSFWDPQLRKLRMELQNCYELALLHLGSYEMAVSKDACELCWKAVFYRPIEEFRARIKIASQSVAAARDSKSSSVDEIESQQHKLHLAFIKFLDESCSSYRVFIWKLNQVYQGEGERGNNFELSSREVEKAAASLGGLTRSPSPPPSLPSLLNRCLVYLGDLYRYKANAQSSIPSSSQQRHPNGSKSDSWQRAIRSYQCAASIFSSSGNPFNQLAVMSYQAGDELRAVYFYFRSLKVSQPFPTARQNLLLLFEKNRSRFSHSHGDIKSRAGAKASTVADVSLSFVRLHGIFFDKINAQDYAQVKDLAFSSLDALMGSSEYLSTLSRSMVFDHLPHHLATLAIFSADQSSTQPVAVLIELLTSLLNASSARAANSNGQENKTICSRLSAGALISIQLIGCKPQSLLQPVLDQIDSSSTGRSDSESFEIILGLLEAGTRYARTVPGLYHSSLAVDEANDSMLLPENKELIGFEPLKMVWERRSASSLSDVNIDLVDQSRVKQLLALLRWLGDNIHTSLSAVADVSHRVVRVRVSCQHLVDESEGGLRGLANQSTVENEPQNHDHHLMAHETMVEEEEEVVVWQPRGGGGGSKQSPFPPPPNPPLDPPLPPLPASLLSSLQPQPNQGLDRYHIEAVSERNLEATALRVAGDFLSSDAPLQGMNSSGQRINEAEDFSFLGMFAVPHH